MRRLILATVLVLFTSTLAAEQVVLFWNPQPDEIANAEGTAFLMDEPENWSTDPDGLDPVFDIPTSAILRFDGTGPNAKKSAQLRAGLVCGGLFSTDEGPNAYTGTIIDAGHTLVIVDGNIDLAGGSLDLTGTLIMAASDDGETERTIRIPEDGSALNDLLLLQGSFVFDGTTIIKGDTITNSGTRVNFGPERIEFTGAGKIADFSGSEQIVFPESLIVLNGAGFVIEFENDEPVPALDVLADATIATDADDIAAVRPDRLTVHAGRTLTMAASVDLQPRELIGELGATIAADASGLGVLTWRGIDGNSLPAEVTYDCNVLLTGDGGDEQSSPIESFSDYALLPGTAFLRDVTIRSGFLNTLTIRVQGTTQVFGNLAIEQVDQESSSIELIWESSGATLVVAGNLDGVTDLSGGTGDVTLSLAEGVDRIRIAVTGSLVLNTDGGQIVGNATMSVGGTIAILAAISSNGFGSEGLGDDLELVTTRLGGDEVATLVLLNGDRWRLVQEGGADIALGNPFLGSLRISTGSDFTLIGAEAFGGERSLTKPATARGKLQSFNTGLQVVFADRDAIVRVASATGEHRIDADVRFDDTDAVIANDAGSAVVGGGRLVFVGPVESAFGGGDGDDLTISGGGRTVFDNEIAADTLALAGPGLTEINSDARVAAVRADNNATLAGEGEIAANGGTGSGRVEAGGSFTISPGDNTRIATLAAVSVDLDDGDPTDGAQAIRIQVNGFAAGITFDQLAVGGDIAFSDARIQVDISTLVAEGSRGGTAAGIITFSSQQGFDPANLEVIGNDDRFAVTLVIDAQRGAIDAVIELENNPPTIALNDPQIVEGTLAITADGTATIAFSVDDAENAAGTLSVVAFSDNPTLLPEGVGGGDGTGALRLGGSGGARTLQIVPQGTGEALVTIRVTDSGELSAEAQFRVIVAAVGGDLVAKFIRATDAFSEGSTGRVVVELDVAPTVATTVNIEVSFPFSAGGAVAGDLALPATEDLTFAPGQTQAVLSFGVVADAEIEGDESFQIAILSTTGVTPDPQNGTFVGVIADQQTALGAAIDGQPLSSGTPIVISRALNQASSLLVFGGQPPYSVSVDNGASLQAGELDAGDANNDGNVEPLQGFLITPRQNGQTTVTVSGSAGALLSAIIDVDAGATLADAPLAAPAVAPSQGGQTLYTAICPGTEAGLADLKAALAGKDATQVKAFAWDAETQSYVQLPAEPTGGLTPAHAIFLATRQDLGLDFTGTPAPAPFKILLRPGFNFVGLPPLAGVTSPDEHRLFGDFTVTNLLGQAIVNGEVALLGNKASLWNGTAYVDIGPGQAEDRLFSGNGYWIFNGSLEGETVLLVRNSDSGTDTSTKPDTRPRAARKAGDPPPPPTESVSRAASGGGGCGNGSGFAALALGLLALALRRLR